MHLQLQKFSVAVQQVRLYSGRIGRLADCRPFTDRPVSGWVHFFLDDYRFEAIWRNPLHYARTWLHLPDPGLTGLVGFDFSLFDNFPHEVNAWNAYRSALLTDFFGRLLERPVLPVASWWARGNNFQYLEPGTALALGGFPLRGGHPQVYLGGLAHLLQDIRPSELHIFGNLPPPEHLAGQHVYHYDLHYHRLNRQNADKSRL
jgi:hypothetical protein